jgi:hypothetical protein
MVEEGRCWWYRKYAPGDTTLEGLEREARDSKRGLWADPAPIPPWVYRKARRGQSLDLSDLVLLDAETDSGSSSRSPPLMGTIEQDFPSSTSTSPYPVIGDRKSHIYHRLDCPNYSQVRHGIEWRGIVLEGQPVPPREWRKRSSHFSPVAEFSGCVAELSKVRADPHSTKPGLMPGGHSLGRKVEYRRFRWSAQRRPTGYKR